MQQNLGNSERLLRGIAGAGLVGVGLGSRNGWVTMAGLFPLYTAITGYCYIYDLWDVNTASK